MLSEHNLNIRSKLTEYLGNDVHNYNITERQKDAIEKLLKLPSVKFIELCDDVVNEVNRRNNDGEIDTSRAMYERLKKLAEEKFKNLVIDVLLVYNYRNSPESVNNVKNTENQIDEVKKETKVVCAEKIANILDDLEKTYTVDNFKLYVEKMGFINKIQEYVNYSKKYVKDEKIAEYMKECLDKYVEEESLIFLETVAYPEKLFKKVEEAGKMNEKLNEIKDTMLTMSTMHEENNNEFREHYLSFLKELTVDVQPYKKVFVYEQEINVFCDILKKMLENKDGEMDLEKMKNEQILPTVDSVLSKASSKTETETVNTLKMRRFLVEGINNVGSKTDALLLILEIAKNVKEIARMSCN